MPTAVVQRITSWSFSRWETYSGCPAQAKYKFIEKRKEPGGPALERGSQIHDLAERYTNGSIKSLPPELKNFKAEFAALRKRKNVQLEQTIALKRDWSLTVYNDWAECWVRIKTDAMYLDGSDLNIIDHKTGKVRDITKEQMELYALGGLLLVPQAKRVRTNAWYLDQGVIKGADDSTGEPKDKTGVYTRAELPKLKKDWEARVKPMLADARFAPKPGPSCTWCHFRKSNGGPCKF